MGRRRFAHSIRWLGLVICATILTLWLLSAWFELALSYREYYVVFVYGGLVDFQWDSYVDRPSGFFRHLAGFPRAHMWRHERGVQFFAAAVPEVLAHPTSNGSRLTIHVPSYLLFLVAALGTVLVWRIRPIQPGHCQYCGYNLTGNVNGRCPECGCATESLGKEDSAVGP